MFVFSKFQGIEVFIDYRENIYPYFCASFNDRVLLMEVVSGKHIGDFPEDLIELVEKWRAKNVIELMNNWKRAEKGIEQKPVEPLPKEEKPKTDNGELAECA